MDKEHKELLIAKICDDIEADSLALVRLFKLANASKETMHKMIDDFWDKVPSTTQLWKEL
jgi:hypothetical protein